MLTTGRSHDGPRTRHDEYPTAQRKLLEALRTEQQGLDAEPAATNRGLGNLTADLAEADALIGIVLDIVQHADNTYRQAPERIRRRFNQLPFEKLVRRRRRQRQPPAGSRAPGTFDSSASRADAGGLSLDVMSDNFAVLVEGSSKNIMVELIENYGNRRQRVERLASAWNQDACSGSALDH